MSRPKHVRISDNDVSLYDGSGRPAALLGKQQSELTAPSVQLGPDDVGRVHCGGQQMNPMGDKVPSTMVSPQPTWKPAIPQMNIAYTMILAIMALVFKVEDEVDPQRRHLLGKPVRKQAYQVVNFEDFLPEDLTAE